MMISITYAPVADNYEISMCNCYAGTSNATVLYTRLPTVDKIEENALRSIGLCYSVTDEIVLIDSGAQVDNVLEASPHR